MLSIIAPRLKASRSPLLAEAEKRQAIPINFLLVISLVRQVIPEEQVPNSGTMVPAQVVLPIIITTSLHP